MLEKYWRTTRPLQSREFLWGNFLGGSLPCMWSYALFLRTKQVISSSRTLLRRINVNAQSFSYIALHLWKTLRVQEKWLSISTGIKISGFLVLGQGFKKHPNIPQGQLLDQVLGMAVRYCVESSREQLILG